MKFSRQEYWSGLPFPSPGDLPNPGMERGGAEPKNLALLELQPGGEGSQHQENRQTL